MRRIVVSVLAALTAGCGPTIGDACTSNDQCGGAVCVLRDFTPGGACTSPCDAKSSTSCPTGSLCVKDALGQDVPGCMRSCTVTSKCREGYLCRSANGSAPVCIGPTGI